MSNIIKKIYNTSSKIEIIVKKASQAILLISNKIISKSKLQLELIKIKWELRQKHVLLGRYVADKKITKSTSDFSHDPLFIESINEISSLKKYRKEIANKKTLK